MCKRPVSMTDEVFDLAQQVARQLDAGMPSKHRLYYIYLYMIIYIDSLRPWLSDVQEACCLEARASLDSVC